MRAAAAFALLTWAACGGGSPAGPPPTTTTTLPAPTARDGWTGEPVAAMFAMGAGQLITVTAPGYLPRVARFTGEPLFLWPQDEEYVRAVVYGNTPVQLYRWTRTSLTVQAPPELIRSASAALAEIHEATGISASFATSGDVVMVIDPNDPLFTENPRSSAFTNAKASAGGTIMSARIAFRSLGAADNAILHELGHAIGLSHSPRRDDVMWGFSDREAFSLSERERVVLRMMYRWRTPGNLPPDREAGVSAAGAGVLTLLAVD